MAQLIIKREKIRTFFSNSNPMFCYVDDCMVCDLKNGDTYTCNVDNGLIEFKCFVPRGPLSDVYTLDTNAVECIHITLKYVSNVLEIDVVENDAINQIIESNQPTVTTMAEDTQTICAHTGVSTQIAEQALVKNGFNVQGAIKSLGGSKPISDIQKKPVTTGFTPTRVVGAYFGVNDKTRQWAVGKGLIPSLKNVIPYSYDDIIDFELIEDGTSITKGGLGRAAVGGILFGNTGAIVGGITGAKKEQRKCTNLTIKITIKNMSAPTVYIRLIASPTDKNSFVYKAAFQSAQEILSILQLICSQQTPEKEVETKAPVEKNVSSADEIRKYKSLLDDGIITEEEFQNKKKQLLGL